MSHEPGNNALIPQPCVFQASIDELKLMTGMKLHEFQEAFSYITHVEDEPKLITGLKLRELQEALSYVTHIKEQSI